MTPPLKAFFSRDATQSVAGVPVGHATEKESRAMCLSIT
jgi:hypothetical protein